MPLVRFMCSEVGRGFRVVGGIALIAIGVFGYRWEDGLLVSAIGFIPLATGLTNVCVFAPLFGCDLHGNSRSVGLWQQATSALSRHLPGRAPIVGSAGLPGAGAGVGVTPPTG
jgi:hypothetical protein